MSKRHDSLLATNKNISPETKEAALLKPRVMETMRGFFNLGQEQIDSITDYDDLWQTFYGSDHCLADAIASLDNQVFNLNDQDTIRVSCKDNLISVFRSWPYEEQSMLPRHALLLIPGRYGNPFESINGHETYVGSQSQPESVRNFLLDSLRDVGELYSLCAKEQLKRGDNGAIVELYSHLRDMAAKLSYDQLATDACRLGLYLPNGILRGAEYLSWLLDDGPKIIQNQNAGEEFLLVDTGWSLTIEQRQQNGYRYIELPRYRRSPTPLIIKDAHIDARLNLEENIDATAARDANSVVAATMTGLANSMAQYLAA